MALLNSTIQVSPQLPKFFDAIREGTAPANFTRQHLKDMGFASSNHHAFIPLLKGLGFLTSDGTPTDRYKRYLDKTQSKKVMAQAVKEAYGDIFVIKSKPTKSDRAAIEGKFKSTYNMSELSASRAASTFLAVLDLADETHLGDDERQVSEATTADVAVVPAQPEKTQNDNREYARSIELGLRYNIQIHLPATKDIEVYNSIFKSIKEHLIE